MGFSPPLGKAVLVLNPVVPSFFYLKKKQTFSTGSGGTVKVSRLIVYASVNGFSLLCSTGVVFSCVCLRPPFPSGFLSSFYLAASTTNVIYRVFTGFYLVFLSSLAFALCQLELILQLTT